MASITLTGVLSIFVVFINILCDLDRLIQSFFDSFPVNLTFNFFSVASAFVLCIEPSTSGPTMVRLEFNPLLFNSSNTNSANSGLYIDENDLTHRRLRLLISLCL